MFYNYVEHTTYSMKKCLYYDGDTQWEGKRRALYLVRKGLRNEKAQLVTVAVIY